jgi:hypothetical protein
MDNPRLPEEARENMQSGSAAQSDPSSIETGCSFDWTKAVGVCSRFPTITALQVS